MKFLRGERQRSGAPRYFSFLLEDSDLIIIFFFAAKAQIFFLVFLFFLRNSCPHSIYIYIAFTMCVSFFIPHGSHEKMESQRNKSNKGKISSPEELPKPTDRVG